MKNILDRVSSLIKDTAVIGLGNIFSKGIVFFLVPLQTAVMSTSDYGVAEMVYNFVNILIPIFTVGIAESGLRFSIDYIDRRKSIFQIINLLPVLGGMVLLCLMYPIFEYLGEYRMYFSQLLLLYFGMSLRDIYLQFSKGLDNLKVYTFSSILFSVVLFLFSYYFLILRKMGVNGYLNSYIYANFITVVFLFYYGGFKEYWKGFNISIEKKLLREMILYSLPLVSNLLAWWITNLSNRYLLAYFCTLSDVGLYSALAKFSLIITTIYGVFFQSWQLSAVKNIEIKNRKYFFGKVYNYFTFAVIFGSSLFMLISKFIAPVLIRGDFIIATNYLPGIVVTGSACCLPAYWGAVYGALKDTKGVLCSTVCGSVASVMLNTILIPHFGILGAIISTIISYFVIVMYRVIDLNRIINIKLNIVKHSFGGIILFLQAIVMSYFNGISNFYEVIFIVFLALIYKDYICNTVAMLKRMLLGN